MTDFSQQPGFGPDSAGPDSPGGNIPVFSVGEISQAVKRSLESTFDHVRVRGEISGFKRAASGHLYMSLKDENAVLDAVCWRGTAGRLGLRPEDGMEVIATGRITSYPGRSKYQIVVEALELAGEGALLKLLEERKRKLAAEGLFAEDRKRPLPYLPEVIGVVTSPTGAVIRDILHRLADRFPRHVLVWPVLVQGEGAAAQVAAAIEGFNALPAEGGPVPRPDLLIVARGGGSLEDLWAFNEEVVVRAAAASEIPLISAVGHETDTTLIDFAADRRAPTPTAAAEMAVPVKSEILAQVLDHDRRLVAAAGRYLEERRLQVEGLGRGLPDPRRILEEMTQRLDDRAERLGLALAATLRERRGAVAELAARLPHPRQQLRLALAGYAPLAERFARLGPTLFESAEKELAALARILESTSYQKVLQRGFAVVRGPEGVLTRAAQISPGLSLDIEFADGRAAARADGGRAPEPAKPKPRARKTAPARKGDDKQGKLL
ncbi:MAG: exodeoxyribonuclease VII large subunit [Kiloniellales bacterium]|nr:exodeoxyribonuclease VII large subunit [Kiloniellales bacterium]